MIFFSILDFLNIQVNMFSPLSRSELVVRVTVHRRGRGGRREIREVGLSRIVSVYSL